MLYVQLTLEDKKEIIKLVNQGLSDVDLGKKYEISRRTANDWRRKIQKEFLNQDIIDDGVCDNFLVKGKSTLYDSEGNVKLEWIKSSLDEETYYKNLKLAIEELIRDVKPIEEVFKPSIINDDIMTFYPMPDLHFGLLVTKDESNHNYDYDLKIARKWVLGAMDYLVQTSPNSKTAVIADLGDFLHSSDNSNRTKSGNILDVDGRYYKIIKISFDVMRLVIEKALEKHEFVEFYSVPGNHSELSGISLKAYLSALFLNNPRVKIIDEHKAQQYHIFGKNILGFSHGHELKPNNASDVLVYDNQTIFSESLHRHWHFGHFHQNKMFETPLCKIEIHKNIIPRDVWAENMGFRGEIGEAKSITYHKEYGEIGRNTFKIKMLED